MLESLHVKNVALIDESHVTFGKGLNILTGETGAGKSIVIDAISAILGERAYRDMIRTGTNKASVRAVFTDVPELSWFKENGVDYDPETGNFVAYSLGDLISDGKRSGTEYSVILKLEIAKSGDTTKITGYSYTPIFTVAERGSNVRSVRIAETMAAYDNNYIKRVTQKTYDAMTYALDRIESRIKGE